MDRIDELSRLEGGFSGCGDEVRTGGMSGAQVEHAVDTRADRLSRMDELRGEQVGELLDARAQQRRNLLRAGGLFGALAAAAPILSRAKADAQGGEALFPVDAGGGKTHVIDSTTETVRWGIFDTNLPNIVDIDSGDTVVLRNTWTHFLNQLQPGLPIDQIATLRLSHPGVGPHSILGPIGVNGAEPGDMLEVQYLRLRTIDFGSCFNNPGWIGTGALPDLFPTGEVKYFDLSNDAATTEFAPGINLQVRPFQGTFGVAPADGAFPTPPGYANGVVSSVPPGRHAGNVDCREAVEGTRVFIPVWKRGAKIFTGDTHALQGDGEVNLSAIESGMRDFRVRVILHKQVGWSWPIHETPTHWIVHGMDKDLNLAFRTALINGIDFLEHRAGLTRLDGYALCSLAVSFRVTQVVNGNKGVYGMIPKSIFHPQLRRAITVI